MPWFLGLSMDNKDIDEIEQGRHILNQIMSPKDIAKLTSWQIMCEVAALKESFKDYPLAKILFGFDTC